MTSTSASQPPLEPLPYVPVSDNAVSTKERKKSFRERLGSFRRKVQERQNVTRIGNTFKTPLSTSSKSMPQPSKNTVANIVATETRVEMGETPAGMNLWKRLSGSNFDSALDSTSFSFATNASTTGSSQHLYTQHQTSPKSNMRQGTKLFTVYKIVVKNGSQQEWAVYKRYSEFDALDKLLKKKYPNLHKSLPELPPKRYIGNSLNPAFIEARAKGLHNFIQQVFASPILLRSEPVREFLCGSMGVSSINAPMIEHSLKPLSQMEETTSDEDEDSGIEDDRSSERKTPDIVFSTTPIQHAPATINSVAPSGTTLRKTNTLRKVLSKLQISSSMLYPFPKHQNSQSASQFDRSKITDIDSASQKDRNSSYESVSSQAHVGIDDFYLLKMIGKGSFGKVMLAKNKDDQKVYAIKVISKSSVKRSSKHKAALGNASSPHDINHIMAERNVLIRSVKHPFLIGLKWAFQTSEKLYFVTDYVNGGEIFFHLQKDCRFSELRARFYAAEITSALEYLHNSDIIYRDLKPENILLDSDGHIKLTDFGLAKENFVKRNRGRTHTFCGTPEYLAPEILRKESYGFSIDWWCLGSVLYEMLVGLPPFYSKDTQEMFQKIQNEKLKFPPYVGIRSRSIISGLLHRSPYFRLGTGSNNTSNPQAVKQHPFFEGIDWEKLFRKEYKPPFVPNVKHSYDLRNIDPTFVNEPIPRSVLEDTKSNAIVEVAQIGESFQGFSYVGDNSFLI